MFFLKQKFVIVLLIACVFSMFFCFPKPIISQTFTQEQIEKHIKLSNPDIASIFRSLPKALTNKWVDVVISTESAEKEAIIMILRQAIRGKLRDYYLKDGPKELGIEFVKLAYQMGKVVTITDMSAMIKELEKLGLNQTMKYLGQWFLENETRIAAGNLEFSYKTLQNQKAKHSFQYLIIYTPKQSQAIIKIYSKESMAPPTSQGSWANGLGTGWNYTQLHSQGQEIAPFVLTIEGPMYHEQTGYWGGEFNHSYNWLGHPQIIINFTDQVPYFKFQELGFFGNFLNKTQSFFQGIGNKINNLFTPASIVDINDFDFGLSMPEENKQQSEQAKKQTSAKTEPSLPNALEKETDKKQETDSNLLELYKKVAELQKQMEQMGKTINSLSLNSPKNCPLGTVNLNIASKEKLMSLTGIGEIRALEIIEKRGENPFKSIDDLLQVSGIGQATLDKIKAQGCASVQSSQEHDNDHDNDHDPEEDLSELNGAGNNNNDEKEDICKRGVNLNTAPLEELVLLTGIGPVIGQRIIDYRKITPFYSLDDLVKVSGIGKAILQKIKEQGCAYVDYSEQSYSYSGSGGGGGGGGASSPAVETEPECGPNSININQAPKQELEKIVHIGPTRADQIIILRQKQAFSSIDDLLQVSGIGQVTLDKIKAQGCAFVQSSQANNNDNDDDDDDNNDNLPALSFADNLIITEVKLGEKEFVELYNPTSQDINMCASKEDCWYFSYYSSSREWNNPWRNKLFSKALAFIVPSQGYYLIGFYGYLKQDGSPNADWRPYSSKTLSNSAGSVGIFSCNPQIATSPEITLEQAIIRAKACEVSVIGWGNNELVKVKQEESATSSPNGKTLARKIAPDSQGYLKYVDTKNNSFDFEIQDPTPKEQNQHSYSDLDSDGIIDELDPLTEIFKDTTLLAG